MAAKTALGLKDLNVAAAVAGHKLYQAHAAKNPNLQPNQILNKISPNARTNYLKLSSSVPSELLGDVSLTQYKNALMRLKQVRSQLNNSFEINYDDDYIINENSINEAI